MDYIPKNIWGSGPKIPTDSSNQSYRVIKMSNAKTKFFKARRTKMKKEEVSDSIGLNLVKSDGLNIRLIKNPSDNLKEIAIKENCYSIFFIDDVDKGLIKLALSRVPNALRDHFFMEVLDKFQSEFDDDIVLTFVSVDSTYIDYLLDKKFKFSGELIETITKKFPGYITRFDTSDDAIWGAIKSKISLINTIPRDKLTKEMIEYALTKRVSFDASLLNNVIAKDDELLKVTLSAKPQLLKHITKVPHEILLEVADQSFGMTFSSFFQFCLVNKYTPEQIHELFKKRTRVKQLTISENKPLMNFYRKHADNPVIPKIQAYIVKRCSGHFKTLWHNRMPITDEVKASFLSRPSNAEFIAKFANPSIRLQRIVINHNPLNIKFIHNPPIEIQMEAVLLNPKAVEHICYEILDEQVAVLAGLTR